MSVRVALGLRFHALHNRPRVFRLGSTFSMAPVLLRAEARLGACADQFRIRDGVVFRAREDLWGRLGECAEAVRRVRVAVGHCLRERQCKVRRWRDRGEDGGIQGVKH